MPKGASDEGRPVEEDPSGFLRITPPMTMTTTNRFPRRARISIAAMAASLVCVLSAGDSHAQATAKKEPLGKLVLIGSSSMNDAFGILMADSLEKGGYSVDRKGYPAAGLSRPDFRDMMKILPSMPVKKGTDAVLVYIGGNDAQALFLRQNERPPKSDGWVRWDDKEWDEVYTSRVQDFVEGLCKKGAKKVIVLPPVDVVGDKMHEKLERVRKAQIKGANAASCGSAVETSGDRGKFTVDGKPMRAKDGIHMSPAGAARVWARIEPKLLKLIGGKR